MRSTQRRLSPFGASDLGGLRTLLERNITATDIRHLRTRFGAVATDIATGVLVLLDQGAPASAVEASISLQ